MLLDCALGTTGRFRQKGCGVLGRRSQELPFMPRLEKIAVLFPALFSPPGQTSAKTV